MIERNILTMPLPFFMGIPTGEDGSEAAVEAAYVRFVSQAPDHSLLRAYLEALANVQRIYDSIDPYQENPLQSLTKKADAILSRHTNIDYSRFIRSAHPEKIETGDFAEIPNAKALRRRTFDFRSLMYLSALNLCEERGQDLRSLLDAVGPAVFPPIKTTVDEPTFKAIEQVLSG